MSVNQECLESSVDSSKIKGHVPIFVVGISGSGKTLVESVLSQHKSVHGAGERKEWVGAVSSILETYSIPKSHSSLAQQLSNDQLREIGTKYFEDTSRHLPECEFFVDTIPANIAHISLILRAIPFAKIIFCQRAPLDTCLSIYFERYNISNKYSYDFENLAAYYTEYQNLMAHWRALYGERIHVVQYEELVRNPETSAAGLYRHCGLDFDPKAHVIQDTQSFHSYLETDLAAVEDGAFATFRIPPTAPETGYGYSFCHEARFPPAIIAGPVLAPLGPPETPMPIRSMTLPSNLRWRHSVSR